MQGYCLNCSNISKYVRGEFHGKIVKTVGIFFGQSNFLTITPSEWRLGKKFKHFFKNLLPLVCMHHNLTRAESTIEPRIFSQTNNQMDIFWGHCMWCPNPPSMNFLPA